MIESPFFTVISFCKVDASCCTILTDNFFANSSFPLVRIVQHDASTLQNDMTVKNGDSIKFGCSELIVYHTPGHSKDSICLVGDGKIFSGDTLFVGNCGRIDLPGGSANELYHSLFDVLHSLDDNLVLYPGHDYGTDTTSTIGNEKTTNPVMQKMNEDSFVDRMGG